MGSGKLIRAAIKKYGIENFTKEILHVFDNAEDMNLKEAELVVVGEGSYNLCPGGQGGWGYINENNLYNHKLAYTNGMGKRFTDDHVRNKWKNSHLRAVRHRREQFSLVAKRGHKDGWFSFSGKKHSQETKDKIRLKAKERIGEKNSQFGTMWITDGLHNKKIKKADHIPHGWYKGRNIPA
jgi:hypothetical protein